MMSLILVRGLPGSGKTAFAELIGEPISADDFFMRGSKYVFDPDLLPQAHADCQARCRARLWEKGHAVVANTFSQRWELQPYLSMGMELGTRVHVVDLFDGGCSDELLFERNSHGVPLAAIRAMRDRWEADWLNGEPAPPWER